MPPRVTGPGLTRKQKFILAERTQESGGNYQAVNPGSGALGAYQVMPANLPGWLADAGLPPMTPRQYLNDPKAQDRLAWKILGGYYDRYGAAGAAAVWYSGRDDPTATFGDPPVYQYVDDVLRLMGEGNFPVNVGTAPGGPAFNLAPEPKAHNWAARVRRAGRGHRRAGRRASHYARQIRKVRL